MQGQSISLHLLLVHYTRYDVARVDLALLIGRMYPSESLPVFPSVLFRLLTGVGARKQAALAAAAVAVVCARARINWWRWRAGRGGASTDSSESEITVRIFDHFPKHCAHGPSFLLPSASSF